jgi:hypothetical protein
MSYRHFHHHHGAKWMPFVFGAFFFMFIFWGGWKLFAFLPLLLLIGGAIWWMKEGHRGQWSSEQWKQEWKHQKRQWKHQWNQWGDEWEGHHDHHDAAGEGRKRKNDDDDKRGTDAKRKNDGDIFYV